MTILQSIFLGALQGVAEFLPISSSGHLAITKEWMGLGEVPVLFDILLHVATLLVVLIVFRKTVIRLLGVFFRLVAFKSRLEDKGDIRLIGAILAATIVTGVIGVVLSNFDLDSNLYLIYSCFIVTGFLLIGASFFNGTKGSGEIGLGRALFCGLAQGIGVLPGISRSGITISAASAIGIKREVAGEFSFLISIPAILGAALLDLGDLGELSHAVTPVALTAGLVTAFVVGMLSLTFLIALIKKGKLYFFSFYLIPLGIIGLVTQFL